MFYFSIPNLDLKTIRCVILVNILSFRDSTITVTNSWFQWSCLSHPSTYHKLVGDNQGSTYLAHGIDCKDDAQMAMMTSSTC